MNNSQFATAIKNYSNNADNGELITLIKKLHADGKEQQYTALLLTKMMEDIDPDILSLLGDCYYQGKGVKRDCSKAERLFVKASQRGSIRADYDIGWLYYEQGNYMHAIECFLRCKNQIEYFTPSQQSIIYHCLGYAYSHLANPDYHRAVEFLSEAAEKYDNVLAYRQLGIIYSTDEHCRDNAKALKFFDCAARGGDLCSVHEMASAYLYGIPDVVERNLSKAEQYLKPHEDCADWDILIDLGVLNKHYEKWQRSAYFFQRAWDLREHAACAGDLGYVYYRLDEYSNAERYLKYADEHGDYSYSDFLGRIYVDQEVGHCNKKLAIQYYEHAFSKNQLNNVYTCMEYVELLIEDGQYQKAYELAENCEKKYNDVEFAYQRAKLVLQGQAWNISKDEAVSLMEECARYDGYKGNASLALGEYCLKSREYRKAEGYFLNAFSNSVADAGVYLGRLYEQGGGTINANSNKAFEWYTRAADAGSYLGKMEIGCFAKGIFGGYKRVKSL